MPRTQSVLEIRYKPAPAFIDYRGRWAEKLVQAIGIPEWKVSHDRVDLYSKDRKVNAFVSFRNMGLIVWDELTGNYSRDMASKAVRAVFDLREFPNKIPIDRVGMRKLVFYDNVKPYEKLVQDFAALGGNAPLLDFVPNQMGQPDIGSMLVVDTQVGRARLNTGPVSPDEVGALMPNHPNRADFGPSGFYADVDVWQKPNVELGEAALRKIVFDLDKCASDVQEQVRSMMQLPR